MRQKIGLVVGTNLRAEMLVEMSDEKINFEFFKENNVNATVLRAAAPAVVPLLPMHQKEIEVYNDCASHPERHSGGHGRRLLL